MGRATRWLRSLLGGKKDSSESKHNSSAGTGDRVKKRWSFDKSGREQGDVAPAAPPPREDSAWLQSLYSTNEKEQSKHAIAVAAATAAAADAAVAAAQAAVAVVRLTNQGRGSVFLGGRERWAAMKIQTVFRGYLVGTAHPSLQEFLHSSCPEPLSVHGFHYSRPLITARFNLRSSSFLLGNLIELPFLPKSFSYFCKNFESPWHLL